MYKFLLVVSAFCLLVFGCRKKENSYLIPADTFQEILSDLHLADGLYMVNYKQLSVHNDSLNFYTDVLKEYNCTFAQFDSTLKYYTNNPEELNKIYTAIVTKFNKLEHESEQLNYMADSASNLYKGKQQWVLPKDGPTKRIPFDIAVQDSSEYTIYVFAKKGADEAENLRITAFYYYKDSASNKEHKDYFSETKYEVGKRFALYTTSKFLSNKKVTSLRGWILDYDKSSEPIRRDVEVKMIAIRKNHRERPR